MATCLAVDLASSAWSNKWKAMSLLVNVVVASQLKVTILLGQLVAGTDLLILTDNTAAQPPKSLLPVTIVLTMVASAIVPTSAWEGDDIAKLAINRRLVSAVNDFMIFTPRVRSGTDYFSKYFQDGFRSQTKFALTVLVAVILRVQVGVMPVQEPLQPVKLKPLTGVAVKMTLVPLS